MPTYHSPGVYINEVAAAPAPTLNTGIPMFIGHSVAGDVNHMALDSLLFNAYSEVIARFGVPNSKSYLLQAVHGFFQNGGQQCYVVPLKNDNPMTLQRGLEAVEVLEDIDLVCAPDIMLGKANPVDMQRRLLDHCEKTGDRFAILDTLQTRDNDQIFAQRRQLQSDFGALYFPWLRIKSEDGTLLNVPPCGHVAGGYADCDNRVGVHKAPANMAVHACLGASFNINRTLLAEMTQHDINCLCRYSLQRGLRTWGARTLSGTSTWRYINVKRLFITIARWCRKNMLEVTFETNTPRLWPRVERALTAYLTELYLRGALKGKTPKEAFYVNCNEVSNSTASIAEGRLITEIGLAATLPNEFVTVQIVHNQTGIYLT